LAVYRFGIQVNIPPGPASQCLPGSYVCCGCACTTTFLGLGSETGVSRIIPRIRAPSGNTVLLSHTPVFMHVLNTVVQSPSDPNTPLLLRYAMQVSRCWLHVRGPTSRCAAWHTGSANMPAITSPVKNVRISFPLLVWRVPTCVQRRQEMIVSGPFRLAGSRQTLVRARQPHQQRGPAGHANRFPRLVKVAQMLLRNRPPRGGSWSPKLQSEWR
jgi:hypothetical protein